MDAERRSLNRRRLFGGASAVAAAGIVGRIALGPNDESPVRAGALRAGPGKSGEVNLPPPKLTVRDTRIVNRLIGKDITGQWYVYGADLGHMFQHHGRTRIVFGDTFGPPRGTPFLGAKPPKDWRSSSLGTLGQAERPDNGLRIDDFVTDRPGHAMQLFPSKKDFKTETTVIPTYGISLGDRIVLHFMSVRRFLSGIDWTLNYSRLAYSDDNGQTWHPQRRATWRGDSPFGQVAMVGVDPYVYLFGVPGGRLGAVRLARVEAKDILNLSEYEYFDGEEWQDSPSAAAPVVPGPSGELSVQWNSFYRSWLMTHQDVHHDRLVLRAARHLTGPWSEPVTIATGAQWPSCYAPFLTPQWNDGPDIFYTMTIYEPDYTVYLMHTRLDGG